jgi:AbiTii
MGLLREIQDEVIDANRRLASVLRKARVLAAELDNEPLRQWASHELNGYPDEAELPPYRAARPVPVRGTFAGPGGQAGNTPIPQASVDERLRDGWLFKFAFTEPVARRVRGGAADRSGRSEGPMAG